MRAAPELLGVPTMGGGSARPRGGGGESNRSEISLSCCLKYTKTVKKWAVSCTFWLINHPKRCFSIKITLQDIIPRYFLRNTSILNFFTT
jgi:hypothetical protein